VDRLFEIHHDLLDGNAIRFTQIQAETSALMICKGNVALCIVVQVKELANHGALVPGGTKRLRVFAGSQWADSRCFLCLGTISEVHVRNNTLNEASLDKKECSVQLSF
jgi:hypothetical protein